MIQATPEDGINKGIKKLEKAAHCRVTVIKYKKRSLKEPFHFKALRKLRQEYETGNSAEGKLVICLVICVFLKIYLGI